MSENLVYQYDEPWQETETFLRLLAGPRFSSPPTDENGLVIRDYSTTISRDLRDHPKMRVNLNDPDDREYVARKICRNKRPAYVGMLISRIEQATDWRRRRDGRCFPVDHYKRTNAHIEYFQALFCDIEGDDIEEQVQRLRDFALHPTMLVWSGHVSLHAYWVLQEPVTARYWDKLMRALCAELRGSRQVLRPMQEMRLPGGVHEETGIPAALMFAGERYYRAKQVTDAITLSAEEIDRYFDGDDRMPIGTEMVQSAESVATRPLGRRA